MGDPAGRLGLVQVVQLFQCWNIVVDMTVVMNSRSAGGGALTDRS